MLERSSNLLPLRGNCDSSEPETSSNYLTRLRAVSHRSWPPSSLLRASGNARPLPEEPVNPALRSKAFTPNFKGPSQPAWLNLSPVTWDHLVNLELIIPPQRSFNELTRAYQKCAFRKQNDMHSLFTGNRGSVRDGREVEAMFIGLLPMSQIF